LYAWIKMFIYLFSNPRTYMLYTYILEGWSWTHGLSFLVAGHLLLTYFAQRQSLHIFSEKVSACTIHTICSSPVETSIICCNYFIPFLFSLFFRMYLTIYIIQIYIYPYIEYRYWVLSTSLQAVSPNEYLLQ